MTYDLSIPGWMTEDELRVLERWATEASTIVEVGSYEGRSAYCFAASNPNAKVHCFDTWGDVQPAATLHSFNKHAADRVSNITAHRVGCSLDIRWPKYRLVDLVFIDAAHRNPSDWEYINFWIPRIRRGGWLAGHDLYRDGRYPDVLENVTALTRHFGPPETPAGTLWRFGV